MTSPATAPDSRRVSTRAPAKINLGLRVGARRADGFHEIESLFLPLDLADEIWVEEIPGSACELQLAGRRDGVPADARNLALQAVQSFLAHAGIQRAVRLHIEKQIPAAAGLGGGSSDAGAALRALAGVFPNAVSAASLQELALGLGSDVPFFLDPRPALVGGIGQRVEPGEGIPRLALLLANPGIPLSTAEVYRAFDTLGGALTPLEPGSRMRRFSRLWDSDRTGDWMRSPALAALLGNDLEAPATRLCPPIARLRSRLESLGARAVAMTGSGPTLYGLFESREAAQQALGQGEFAPPLWARVAVSLPSP